ncbi:MAG: hypothetical protein IJ479_05775 [Alphaproteobacteria bacterium]|nr:hypothetical protein [Alphaproteobacteria bacterium]
MFGFGKKKDHAAEYAALFAALALTMGENSTKREQNPFSSANKRVICAELSRLKADHWDKNAFDALIEFVNTL